MRYTSLLTLFLFAMSCQSFTPKTWDKGYPKAASELKTDEEKKKEFATFAVVERHHHPLGLDAGFGEYSAESFAPVVKNVSPQTEAKFEHLNSLQRWTNVAMGVTIAGVLLGSGRCNKPGNVLFALGVGGFFGLAMMSSQTMSEIKTDYLEGLNNRIYGGKTTSSLSQPQGYSLGFTLSL